MQEKAVNKTITEQLKWAVATLAEVIDTPSIDAHIILEEVIQKNKLYMIMNKDEKISGAQEDLFIKWVNMRKSGIPVQYIVHHQEFMGLDFYVDENVLIPRSDTEPLVEELIRISKEEFGHSDEQKIMDIGTGSGAITISLASLIAHCKVTSVDISEDAIKVARKNAAVNGVTNQIEFIKSNLFDNIDENKYKKYFDIIVSNPPYIPSEDIDALQVEVAVHEPRLALDGGADGFDLYKRIIKNAHKYLKKNGTLAFEVGYNQSSEIKEMLLGAGYDKIRFVQDLSGINRIVIGILGND